MTPAARRAATAAFAVTVLLARVDRGGVPVTPRDWPATAADLVVEHLITDVPGVTWNEALKACGNGVVPQQGAAAVRWLIAMGAVA
jgi:hypothetical protein